jgi:hypothetical protein
MRLWDVGIGKNKDETSSSSSLFSSSSNAMNVEENTTCHKGKYRIKEISDSFLIF